MRDKRFALIKRLILQDDWFTVKQLSSNINILEISVENYISKINYTEKDLIESSQKCYIINQ
ncbi:hypothetical protein CLPUN_44520 [Clostridium puniceum]|uniref:Uncharacterized protein n=1 Tax=Clostridium puniceum TaxID=29367 RepID=A0A1S8T7M8_9CLOT|nr:hypothetical protein [Clostridium puniceum]OOM73698.1 hypothetical protein CLPUN_44520 [Clostridium puniceum]